MNYKRLGKTESQVSEIAFGGIPVLRLPYLEKVRLVEAVVDRGVTFLDTLHGYGDSEDKIWAAFTSAGKRKQCIISSKSPGREKNIYRTSRSIS